MKPFPFMSVVVVLAIATGLLLPPRSNAPETATQPLLLAEGFEQPSPVKEILLNHQHIDLAPDFAALWAPEDTSNQAIRVTYQGSERGSDRVVRSLPIAASGDDLLLSFDVQFCTGFDFARGGKLHGLGPRKPVTGGNEMMPQGWSSRLMWHRDGQLQTYIYHHDKAGRYGDTKRAQNFQFESGEYYRVSMRTRLNQPDQADGLVQVWVNDALLIEHEGLRFRTEGGSASDIHQVLFSTFHGGSSPEWAPRDSAGNFKQDCAYFDNFQVRHYE